MNKKNNSNLWLLFTLIVFLIMLSSLFILGLIAIISYHLNIFDNFTFPRITPIIPLFLISIIIGTIISMLVARKILNPISKLSNATKEIAKGNFNIKLNESYRIREIREIFINFNTMVNELNSIETLRDDFITNVSHEFKTPISAIEGYATLLNDQNLTKDELSEYTTIIKESSTQLSDLIGNILKISKINNQDILPDKTTYRLDEQIRKAILVLENRWNKKNIDFKLDLENIMYYGYKNLMFQVWINLLDNAFKFTEYSGILTIVLKKDPNSINITIKDTGLGMDDYTKKHIFDKFFQGNISKGTKGNGLGLSLVSKIIELSKGTITVSSELGKGSVFTISLPIIE